MNALKNLLVLALIIPFCGYSQKLPSKQPAGLSIPANLKIDGKANEWNNTFKAYNNSIEAFYSIANDKEKLYLVIQATNPVVIRKLIAGGVTFSIYNSENRKEKPLIAATYPVFEKKNIPNVNWENKMVATLNAMQLDSFKNVINKQIIDRSKEVKIIGSKLLRDSVLSVYNEEGIKAVSSFDDKISYTYELLIPVKFIEFTADQKKFYYNIKLNGSDRDGISSIENVEGGVRVNGPGKMADMQFIWSPTDLWGEYELVRK